jgi:hypothetical protein
MVVIFFYDFNFPREEHRNSTLPRDDLQGFKARIKEQNRLHLQTPQNYVSEEKLDHGKTLRRPSN